MCESATIGGGATPVLHISFLFIHNTQIYTIDCDQRPRSMRGNALAQTFKGTFTTLKCKFTVLETASKNKL